MQNTKSVKLNTIIRPLAMILITALLLVYGTYSWVRRQWTPTIEQTGIKIATGDSLSFMFDDNTYGYETSINSMLDMKDFVLKSVSNASGESEHFFTLLHSPRGVGHETYKHIGLDDLIDEEVDPGMEYTELGKQYGYAEMKFKIYAAESASEQRVFIDAASHIKNSASFIPADNPGINPAMSLRVSITWDTGELDEDENPMKTTVIFAMDERVAAGSHKAVTNALERGTSIYVAEGEKRCSYIDNDINKDLVLDANGNPVEAEKFDLGSDAGKVDAFKTATLHKFSDYDGTTEEKSLFTLAGGTYKEVTVRIWLEGVDEHCVDAIAGKELDLLLIFAATKSSTEGTTSPESTTSTVSTTSPESTTSPVTTE